MGGLEAALDERVAFTHPFAIDAGPQEQDGKGERLRLAVGRIHMEVRPIPTHIALHEAADRFDLDPIVLDHVLVKRPYLVTANEYTLALTGRNHILGVELRHNGLSVVSRERLLLEIVFRP